jgi:hypothetical protein
VNLGSNDIEYAAWDGTKTVYSPNGGLIPSITASAVSTLTSHSVTWQTPPQVTDSIYIETLPAGGSSTSWAKVGENMSDSGYCYFQRQQSAAGSANARLYGIGLNNKADGTSQVVFGNAGSQTSGGGYAAVGTNYPLTSGDRYRVVKVKAGVATGFGLAANGNSGLINYYNESNFTSTFTFNGSGGTTGAINISAIRVGKLVTVHVKEGPVVGTGTNSNTLASNTAIPAWARPGTTVTGATPEIRIGVGPTWSTNGLGRFRLGSDGIISIARDNQGSNWPNSTSGCGVNNGFSISYTVD